MHVAGAVARPEGSQSGDRRAATGLTEAADGTARAAGSVAAGNRTGIRHDLDVGGQHARRDEQTEWKAGAAAQRDDAPDAAALRAEPDVQAPVAAQVGQVRELESRGLAVTLELGVDRAVEDRSVARDAQRERALATGPCRRCRDDLDRQTPLVAECPP